MDGANPTVYAAQRIPLAGKASTSQTAAISLSPVFQPLNNTLRPTFPPISPNFCTNSANFSDFLKFFEKSKGRSPMALQLSVAR
jgi:hypothetical protein